MQSSRSWESPRRVLPGGAPSWEAEVWPWAAPMLMEPRRGLGGKPQEEFPAETPRRPAGAGRAQTRGRGGGRAQSWGNRPQMFRWHRCSGPFEVRGPASSEGRNTPHVNITCAAGTLHHLGAGWGGEGWWRKRHPALCWPGPFGLSSPPLRLWIRALPARWAGELPPGCGAWPEGALGSSALVCGYEMQSVVWRVQAGRGRSEQPAKDAGLSGLSPPWDGTGGPAFGGRRERGRETGRPSTRQLSA